MKREAALKPNVKHSRAEADPALPFILSIDKMVAITFFIAVVSWASQSQLMRSVLMSNTDTDAPSVRYVEVKPELPHFNSCCDFPSTDQDAIESSTHTLSDPAAADNAPASLKAESFKHERLIRKVSSEMNFDISLIYAVIKAESAFNTNAESHAGAIGLMQIVADRAGIDAYRRVFNKHQAPSTAELKDPYTNLRLGTSYLKLLSNHYFKNIKDKKLKKMLILAAYNWGPINVKRKLLKRNPPRNAAEAKWVLYVRAPKETANYVSKVLRFEKEFLEEENS